MKPRVFKSGGLWWVEFEFGVASSPSWADAYRLACRYA